MASTTVYLKLRPKWGQVWKGHGYVRDVTGVEVAGVVKNRPSRTGGLVAKLTINVPDSVFRPLEPAIEVTIPESKVEHIVTVEVEDPDELADQGADEPCDTCGVLLGDHVIDDVARQCAEIERQEQNLEDDDAEGS